MEWAFYFGPGECLLDQVLELGLFLDFVIIQRSKWFIIYALGTISVQTEF